MTTNIFDQIDGATAADLFGAATNPQKLYKRLARQVHPDMVDPADRTRAENVFVRLTALWESYQHGTQDPGTGKNTIKTKRRTYDLEQPLWSDDVFTAYRATHDAGHAQATILIANDPADEDLVAAYVTALKKLRVEVPEEYRMFYPEFLEQFRYQQNSTFHPALAVAGSGNLYTLAQIKTAYPAGINGRDIAWLWRRMLVALGNAHDVGLVHGAPTLDAWLIEPDQHGVLLTSWQYSVETGGKLLAVPQAAKSLYPADVLGGGEVNPALDLRLAAASMLQLCDAATPAAIKAHLRGYTLTKLPPAAELLGEFDDVLDRVYGKRTFHVFHMPPK